MYKVLKYFVDLQDNNFEYKEGDVYPRDGFSVLQSRLNELASTKNRRGEALIEELEEEKPKKSTKKKDEE